MTAWDIISAVCLIAAIVGEVIVIVLCVVAAVMLEKVERDYRKIKEGHNGTE